ncbi:NADPH-dependent FMN reductase [Neomoorella glycerini]|uniref:NADPH-dependent FMN reductase n=1 Tax=Neomoorella glycerini TaxID=55779 RepID=A0A6I5ZU04_9FIRM|nr:flavodoxin family protein [Moorella glycerini]QGP93168.1 NADPH-dependent FMN reductase [Moorella glycerini]
MKITGVVCTPRVGGNSEVLVRQALAGAAAAGAEGDIIFIRDKHIQPCDGCLNCSKTGSCHWRDDMEEIGEQLVASDGIVIGVPTYWTIGGLGVTFLDRVLPYFYAGRLANKVGAGIVVGARVAVDTVAGVLRRFFLYGHMHCVECICHYGTMPGDIAQNEYAMKQAWELGRLMVLFAANGNRYPEEFTIPFSSYIKKKYHVLPFRLPS